MICLPQLVRWRDGASTADVSACTCCAHASSTPILVAQRRRPASRESRCAETSFGVPTGASRGGMLRPAEHPQPSEPVHGSARVTLRAPPAPLRCARAREQAQPTNLCVRCRRVILTCSLGVYHATSNRACDQNTICGRGGFGSILRLSRSGTFVTTLRNRSPGSPCGSPTPHPDRAAIQPEHRRMLAHIMRRLDRHCTS